MFVPVGQIHSGNLSVSALVTASTAQSKRDYDMTGRGEKSADSREVHYKRQSAVGAPAKGKLRGDALSMRISAMSRMVLPLLDVDLESQIDLGRGYAAAYAPVLRAALAQQHLDVVGRDAKLAQIANHCLIQPALRLH